MYANIEFILRCDHKPWLICCHSRPLRGRRSGIRWWRRRTRWRLSWICGGGSLTGRGRGRRWHPFIIIEYNKIKINSINDWFVYCFPYYYYCIFCRLFFCSLFFFLLFFNFIIYKLFYSTKIFIWLYSNP